MEIVNRASVTGNKKGGNPTKNLPPVNCNDEAATKQIVSYAYNLSDQTKRFHAWVVEFNSRQILLKDTIRGNMVQTFEAILWLNLKKVSRYLADEPLPGLYTTNPEIAKPCKWSERTVRQHITRFLELGLITEKRFRGSKAPYVLWINRWILTGIGPKPTPPKRQKSTFTPPSLRGYAPISPHIPCRTIINLINKGCGLVYNPTFERNSSEEHGEHPMKGNSLKNMVNNFLTNKGGQDTPSLQTMMTNGGGARRGVEDADNAQSTTQDWLAQIKAKAESEAFPEPEDKGGQDKPEHSESRKPQRKTEPGMSASQRRSENYGYYLSLVTLFWEYAKQRLYSTYQFDPEQEKQFKNLIYKQVYYCFPHTWSRKRWDEYHQQLIERIDLAARWKSRDQERYIPLPHKYFDRKFEKGFVRTHDWWLQNEAVRINMKRCTELAKARESIAKQQLPGSALAKDSHTVVYNYWKQRIGKLQDPDALLALDAMFTAQHTLPLF